MKTLFRTLIMLALAAWLGALFFFPFLAQIAFSRESDRQTAGAIVAASLAALHRTGMICGLLILLLLVVGQLRRTFRRTPYPAMALLLAMLAITAASQSWIMPRMESYRIAAGGSISLAPASDPKRVAFEKLHRVSVDMEAAVMLSGMLLAVALAWLGGDADRRTT